MRRKQRGGFFGMLGTMKRMENFIDPIARQMPRAIATGMQIKKDVDEGKNWKMAALDRIPESLKQVVSGKPFQLGSGVRRRRIKRQSKKRAPKKRKHGVHSRRVV